MEAVTAHACPDCFSPRLWNPGPAGLISLQFPGEALQGALAFAAADDGADQRRGELASARGTRSQADSKVILVPPPGSSSSV